MDIFDQFKNRVGNAQKFFAHFSQNTSFPLEKRGNGLFTAREAATIMAEFTNLLASATKHKNRFIRRITVTDMNSMSNAIDNAEAAASAEDFDSFVAYMENLIPSINTVEMLFMDLADNSRYQQISDMENTLIQIKSQDAEVSNILKNANSTASQINKTAETTSKTIEELENQNTKSQELLNNFNNHQTTAQQHEQTMKNLLDHSKSHMAEISYAAELAQQQKIIIDIRDTEATEYRQKITDLATRHENIIAEQTQKNEKGNKETQELIDQANYALELSAAAGLSKVFVARRKQAANRKVKRFWIGLSLLSSASAIGLGWLALESPNDIDSDVLIVRALLLFITMAVATFSARQYAKNKTIEEDYSYKSALVGSFPGLMNELKKADPQYRERYVNKFLDELLQDPQRERRQDPQKERQYDNRDISDALKEKVFNQPPGNS